MLTLARAALRKLVVSLLLLLAIVGGCLLFGPRFGAPIVVEIDRLATVDESALVRVTDATVLLSGWQVEPERPRASDHGLRRPSIVAAPVLTQAQAALWSSQAATGRPVPIPGPVVYMRLGQAEARTLRRRLEAGERAVQIEPVGHRRDPLPEWLAEAITNDGIFGPDAVVYLRSTNDSIAPRIMALMLSLLGAVIAVVTALLFVVERRLARRDGDTAGAGRVI